MSASLRGFPRLIWPCLAVLALACSAKNKTLLLVDVSLENGVSAPERVRIDVATGSGSLGSTTFDWAKAKNGILSTGTYLPDGVSGQVTITATGETGGVGQSRDSIPANLETDKTNGPITLTLKSLPVEGGGDAGLDSSAAPDAESAETLGEVRPEEPDAPRSSSEAGGTEVSENDASAVGLPDGGVDASGAEAPTQDSEQGQVDAPALGQLDVPAGEVAEGDADFTDDADSDATGVLAWQPAEDLDKDAVAPAYSPVIAVEPIAENVFVAWYESDQVKVVRYDRRAGTWGAAKTIENRGSPGQVALGTDASGHIMLAWVQQSSGSDSSLYGVWVSQSNDGVTWSDPQQVAAGEVSSLRLAMARNGVARMAWSRKTGTNQKGLFTATFDKTAWAVDPAPVVDPNSPENTDLEDPNPQLVMGGTGDGILLFDVRDAEKLISIGAVALTGSTRSTLRILDTDTNSDLYFADRSAAMNAKGEGVVVWPQDTSSTAASLNLVSYDSSNGWSSVEQVVEAEEFHSPGTALDDNGYLTIAWAQPLTGSGYNLRAIHGKPGGSWSAITTLEDDNQASANYNELAYPMLAADGFGNVLAVWTKKVDAKTYGAYATRLQGALWQAPVKLGQKTDLQTPWPHVAVADSGFGAATYATYAVTTSDPDAYKVEVAFCR